MLLSIAVTTASTVFKQAQINSSVNDKANTVYQNDRLLQKNPNWFKILLRFFNQAGIQEKTPNYINGSSLTHDY